MNNTKTRVFTFGSAFAAANCPSARARTRRLTVLSLLATALLALPTGAGERAPGNDEDDGERFGVRYDRLALVGGGGLAARYVGFKYVDRAWYQGQKLDHIRWVNDWSGETYLNIDKAGHFFGGLFMAQGMMQAYAWTGFTPPTAAALGTLTSWAALLEIEMRDAHFDQWGFSIPDFVANSVGAGVPLMHTLFPATRIVNFKLGYHPSRLYRDRVDRQAAGKPHYDHLIDDYEGMTFWMTLAVDDLLRGEIERRWPDQLGLALGYGAVGLHGENAKSTGPDRGYPELPDARPELFLALDYDTRYLPGEGPLWSLFKSQLRWIHLPAPTVRLYPELRFYLLYM